jgi:hypothetical protein
MAVLMLLFPLITQPFEENLIYVPRWLIPKSELFILNNVPKTEVRLQQNCKLRVKKGRAFCPFSSLLVPLASSGLLFDESVSRSPRQWLVI